MDIKIFTLEEFFEKNEFEVEHLLCASDCEPLTIQHILSCAGRETRSLWDNLSLGYTDPKGHPLLREEIARCYGRLAADDILVVAPEEGIFLTMMAALERGDKIIVPFPAYQSLYEIAAFMGCEVVHYQPEETNETWRFSAEALCSMMLRLKPQMVVINFPHNPTGAMITQDELDTIVDVAAREGITIFSDEMYRFLEHNKQMRLTSVSDRYHDGISLCGLSKSFALPGLRIGWLASTNGILLKRIRQFKNYTTICSSAPSEILALIALRAKSDILKRNRQLVLRNKELVRTFCRKYDHLFGWREPEGGSIAFLRYHGSEGTKKFCDDLLEKKSVLLAPASMFGAGDSHFRIGLGRTGMKPSLDEMEKYMKIKKSD
jgi:aspartate/methionine/tyrosine aminotransferase